MAASVAVAVLPRRYSGSGLAKKYALRSKAIRLRALKADPAYFASTFETESRFSMETWIGRVTNPMARTFIAMRKPCSETSKEITERDLDEEWLGTVVLLGPKLVTRGAINAATPPWQLFTPTPGPSPEASPKEDSILVYQINAVWVAPEARGSGVGALMVQAALEAARTEVAEGARKTASVFVLVEKDNVAGMRLYQKSGFAFVAEQNYTSPDGRTGTGVMLQLELA